MGASTSTPSGGRARSPSTTALVTAPIFGFADERDYWARSSSRPYLPKIRRPALLINAVNDPFVPPGGACREAEVARLALARGGLRARGRPRGLSRGPVGPPLVGGAPGAGVPAPPPRAVVTTGCRAWIPRRATASSCPADVAARAARRLRPRRARRCWASARTPSSLVRGGGGRDPGLRARRARASRCRSTSTRRSPRAARRWTRRGRGGGAPLTSASAATSRRSPSGSAGAATTRSALMQGDPRRAPARHGPAPAPVLHLLLAGALGRHAGADRVAWSAPSTDDSYVLGLHAFGLEENRRFDEALALAERAMALNPRDAWAVHAMAHVLYERGRQRARASRPCRPRIHPCDHLGYFRNHLLWHLALMHLADGRYERAAALFQSVFGDIPDHRRAPTSRTRWRWRGGSTSSAVRTPRAGSTWARPRALARPAAAALPRPPRGHGPGRVR